MSVAGFDEFVQDEQSKLKVQGEFDAQRDKKEWLQSLNELYVLVEEYLSDYVTAGHIFITRRTISLNEEQLGIYDAPELLITIGTKAIRFEPIGRFIFGAWGRVDVAGPFGRGTLLLIASHIQRSSEMLRISFREKGALATPGISQPGRPQDPVWRIVTRPPELKIIKLDKDTLFTLILELANG